jgi:hypothetical protein
MKPAQGWEWRSGLLIVVGVAAAIAALLVIASPPEARIDDRATELADKWTVSLGALVFGMVSFSVGAL